MPHRIDSTLSPALAITPSETGGIEDQQVEAIVDQSWQQHTGTRNTNPDEPISRMLSPNRKPWQKSIWAISAKVLAAASTVALIAGFSILGAGIPTLAIAASLVLIFTLDLACTIYHEYQLAHGEPGLIGGGNVLKNLGMWCARKCGASQQEQEYTGNIMSVTVRCLLYIALPIEGLLTLTVSILIPKILLSLVPALFDLCGGLSQLVATSPHSPATEEDSAALMQHLRDIRRILLKEENRDLQQVRALLEELEATLAAQQDRSRRLRDDRQQERYTGPDWLYAIDRTGCLQETAPAPA
jgi:hypothetical protein